MQFTKMHGTGNDYVVVDARAREEDWAELARLMCARHVGVGADGLLLVAPSRTAQVRMRMFNPDGSEAEMCGNGIRCFAKYVVERGIVELPPGALHVETGDGVKAVEPRMASGRVVAARVDMGHPRLRREEIPVDVRLLGQAAASARKGPAASVLAALRLSSREVVFDHRLAMDGADLDITTVSMGNPHAVAFVEAPVDSVPLEVLGPRVENHPLFPRRVNVHIVNVVDRRHLKARHWERGAGLTLACGTGACAVAVAARLHGFIDEKVDVAVPGGVLAITWRPGGPVLMEGPAVEVFDGEWREE